MPYEELLNRGHIRPYVASGTEVKRLLSIAKRDLSTSEAILSKDPDWSYNITYNAVLQSSRALMFSKGFRPRGEGQHATVVRFIRETLGQEFYDLVELFDQMRRKRNRIVYEMTSLVGNKEAKEVLAIARRFVSLMNDLISESID